MALVPPTKRTKLGISHRTLCGIIVWLSLQFLLVHGDGNTKGESPPVDQSVSFNIEEGQRAGTKVGVIPIRQGLRYRFSEPPTEFSLDPETGTIITTMVLDRESLSDDVFDLFVQSTPSAKHIIEIKITVLDINDNSPTFRQPVVQILFPETAKPGTQVILDTATDKDAGLNGITTKYRLVSGNQLGRFQLVRDVSLPFLYLENTKELDREEKAFYQLRMSVQDGGTPPRYGYLTINITVQDYNDNPPLFDQSDYSSSVNETSPAGTSIIQVHATDLDIGANADITYSVINDDYNQFTVAPKTGVVSSLKKLYCYRPCDGSVASCMPNSCMVTLEARDNGGPTPLTGRAYLTVNLIDENDHSPVIKFKYHPSGSYAKVDEGAPKSHFVAMVSVTDRDTGLNGRTMLRIIKGNEKQHFKLESYIGYYFVKVAGGLDRERIGRYNLTFKATDGGTPSRSSTAYMIIVVNDINDHSPVFQHQSYSAELSELVPVGSFVAAITATDSDTGINAQITYTIASGNQRGYFKINSETGLVMTAKSLDHETESRIVMTILAKDGAARPQQVYTNLTVDIWDENDETPSFHKFSFSVSITEGQTEHVNIITVMAVDNDEGRNGTVRYMFDSEVERKYPGIFQLNPVSGRISTLQRLDREEHAFFVLKLWAHDQGITPLSSYTTIFITVLDVNDNSPVVYPANYYATLMENEPSGASVIQVTASDPDAGKNGTMQYAITETEDGRKKKFSIDGSTGWIVTNGRLKEATYTLTVNVQDLGAPARQAGHSATVHIRVSKTMTRVEFSQSHGYSFSVVEDGQGVSKVGENVGQVQTKGTTGAVSYSIVDGDLRGAFEINTETGMIRRVTSIDREDTPVYHLNVVAQNNGVFGSTVVNITINDVNDNIPTFESYKVEVYAVENWPVGHDVYLARAEDKDIGDNAKVIYTVTKGLLPIFDIHQETGMLYLAHTLTGVTNTTFVGHVIAKDSGTPSRSGEIRLTVKVQPSNVHTPVFEYANYLVLVNESRPINDEIYHVGASDVDKGINGQVTYSLVSGNDNGTFGIFPNGDLYIANTLDRETQDWYILKVEAKDHGIPSRSSTVDITISIMDANDNSPVFVNHTYVMSLEEGNTPKTYIGMVSASDADIGPNAEIMYSFEGTDNRFAINSKTGAIMSERSFDREELIGLTNLDYVTLVVVARDFGEQPKEDRASVEVHITDVNDNAPMFTRNVYETSISESAQINTEVLVVLAKDKDSGLNSKVSYFLQDGNNERTFAIDKDTGKVTVIKHLDRETMSMYTLVVLAIDGGVTSLNSTAHMKITILDNNDNAPQFVQSQRTFDIKEDEHMEYLVVQLSATDTDLGINATVAYSIVDGNVGSMFRIDSDSGKLFLTGSLDYEKRRQYKLNVTAVDLGMPPRSSSITITINVIDVNDNAPKFSTVSVLQRVTEGVEIGTSVVTITASDLDSGLNGRLTYSIVKQEPVGDTFTINHESGKISTTGKLDRERIDNYRLVVMATDSAQPVAVRKSVQKMVTIIVADVNDNIPEFVSMDSVTVPSNAPIDYLVTTVKAIDLDNDKNGEIEYGIMNGDTNTFNMDPSSGSIHLRSALTSNMLSYDLTVRAQDKGTDDSLGQKTSFFQLTIFVKSTDDSGPRFSESHYLGQVYENKPAETSVLTVHASYAQKPGASIEFRITGITSNGEAQRRYFQVHPTSGVISTTEVLDLENGYEVFELEVFTVEMGSSVPHTRATLVKVTLLDRNDCPPTFKETSYDVKVAENVNPGHVVSTLLAEDPDKDSTIQYSIKDGADGKFSIDPVKGALTVVSRLDRETKASYDITVAASDGVQSSTVIVTVQVTDINDDIPTFEQPEYWFEVSEGAQLGSNVGLVSALDKDLGSNAGVTYSLASHWGRDKFSLHPRTGVITLIGVVDYEQIQHYILTVKAQDSGATSLSSTVSVYVNILDENDNSPIFDPGTYSDEVLENATIGTSILVVTTTDIDSGDNARVKYQIISGDDHGQFEINADTGVIRVSGRLDRESLSYYNLAVRGTDQANTHQLSTTVMVNVIVTDVNDVAPEFVSFMEVTVREDMAVSTSVFKVIAKDVDQGRNSEIQYSLHDGSPFTIEPDSGVLTVSRVLDRENVDKYVIDVTATDKGQPHLSTTARLVIHIGDANDNTPVIDPSVYTATLNENTSVGTTVLSISATDADIGLNAELQYTIVAGDDDAYFYLDAHSGVLSIGRRLDYERKTRYILKVRVQDFGSPSRGGFAEVRISIVDVNDCTPEFVDNPYVVYVQENVETLPVFVTRVMAKDDDSPPYNHVTYSILDGDRSIFHINSTTGVITATKTFDRETLAWYQLVVTGSNSDQRRLLGSSTVTVIVTDVNDHAPVFQQSRYIATVRENLSPPAKVTRVMASDADEGDNAKIRYSLVSDMAGRFTINPLTGEIQTTESLDREMMSEYHLIVMAADSGNIPQSSSVEVIINVEDVNDNSLVFTQQNLRIRVRNPTEEGSFLLGVSATDRDDTSSDQVEYKVSGDTANSVIIDTKTGIVTAKSRLTSDATSSLNFTIQATNENWHGTTAETKVMLSFLPTDTKDFPTFSPSQRHFRIAETAKVGHLVTTVTATSPKPSATISYYIAGGNIDESFMVTDSGEVKVHNNLDYERTKTYVLYIESRDDDMPPLSTFALLNIVIEDENDNAPVFVTSYFNTSVIEDEFSPLEVTTISAEDADSGENGKIKYRFVGGNDNDAFDIDEDSGKITTSMTLDREAQSHYVLTIAAVDQGQPQKTAEATVDVYVLDKNDHPPVFTQYFNSKLPENSPVGTFVVRVTSTDRDVSPNNRHSYSLTSNPGGKFAIDPDSGNVTVVAPLDRETKDEYILQVAANDGAYNAETSLAIDVLDVNDNAPEFDKLTYRFDFVASHPVGTLIGKVSATDRDIRDNEEMYFRLVTPSAMMRLDAKTGELFSSTVLQFVDVELSPINTLSLTVMAIDRGSPPMSSTATVTVVIQSANEHAPVFEKETYSTAVMDHSAVGTSIIQITASDADKRGMNAEVQYKQIGNISQYFKIDSSTGWLTVARSLIGVQQKSYTLQIEARDKGDPPKQAIASVHLQVAPMNLHVPQFHGTGLSFQVTVPENKPVGTTIAGVTADDDDDGPNGQVSYYITGGDTEGLFSIDKSKGYLKIAKPLDYETATEHQLNVTARDQGVIPQQTTRGFTVYLTDVNDNAPVFRQDVYDADVVENSPSGITILQLNAADDDTSPNAVIWYYITDSAQAGSKFNINPETGMLHCQGHLDYEIQSEYKVVVKAMNPDTTLSGTTTVLVHVTGVNEYVPQFTEPEYIFVVSESARPGHKAGAVLATDADGGEEGRVMYYLIGDSNMKGFQIGRKSGEITIVNSIDRETTNEIILEVLAKNRGPIRGNDTARSHVRIKVRDANDPPQFTQSVFEDTVKENSAHGTQVLKLSAIDNDLKADFNQFSYQILAGNIGSAFKVNPTSGWVLVNGELDRERIETYNLTVAAVDTGHPPKTGTAIVKIHLGDVNDNGPHFEPSIPVGHVTENQEPMSNIVINLVTFTRDLDLVPNKEPYKYHLLDNTDLFVIGETSGLVQTRKSLDREAVSKYQVRLRVTDGGKPTMTSTLTMAVAVDDVNDNPSRARELHVMVYAYNGRVDSGKIADVRPQDDDVVGNYQCTISSGDQSKFTIPRSCDLHVTALRSMETFDLGISGSDGRHSKVDYRTTIKFNRFDRSSIDKGIAVHLPDVTATKFLADSYTAFAQIMRQTLPNDQKLLLYNIADLPPHGTRLMLAVTTANGNYLARNLVAQILTNNQQAIEQKSGIRISAINYDPCAMEACLHGGKCSYKMSVGDAMTIIDSAALVFSSATITGNMQCTCPDGFVGSRCERQVTGCNIDGCSNGGTCCREADSSYQCYCRPSWKGPLCTIDVDECDMTPCQNDATCVNTAGSYHCQCPPGYTGVNCEYTIEYCERSACDSITSTTVAPHLCMCKYGNDGEHCEGNIRSFSPISYIEYSVAMATQRNHIIIEFATVKRNALLFYYPAGSEEYIALEIVNNTVRFSYALGTGDHSSITLPKVINDGRWHRLEADRNGNVGMLQVTDCTEDGTTCTTCDSSDSTCYQLTYGKYQRLNTERTHFTVGGVKDFSSLLRHKGQVSTHDFVGCMRNIQLNDMELLMVSATSEELTTRTCLRTGSSLCAADTCSNGATCIDEWESYRCRCRSGFTGPRCEKEVAGGFSFGANALVKYKQKESYQRDQQLLGAQSRRKRAVPSASRPSVMLRFRTNEKEGILFTATSGVDSYTLLHLTDGQVWYQTVRSGSIDRLLASDSQVSDGEWHSVRLTITGGDVSVQVDGAVVTSKSLTPPPHQPLALDVVYLSIGGAELDVQVDSHRIPGFSGCIDDFQINGEHQPFEGATDRFTIESRGEVGASCTQFAAIGSKGGASTQLAVTIICVFFAIILIIILATFIILRVRRRNKERQAAAFAKQNGVDKTSGDNRSHQDSGFTDGGDFSEEGIIQQHITNELTSQLYNEREVGERLSRPDIIVPESVPVVLADGQVVIENSGVDNDGYLSEVPEHYDIDNTSSIAPSDLVDVVSHYRHYRSGMLPASSRHRKHTHRHTPSPSTMLMSRHSPSHLDPIMQRHSPAMITPSPLTIGNVSKLGKMKPMKVQPVQQADPVVSRVSSPHRLLTSPHQPNPTSHRSTPLSCIGTLYPSNISSSTAPSFSDVATMPNGRVDSRPNSRLQQPISQLGYRITPTLGLTVEEVDRLNARREASPIMTLDVASSSSSSNDNAGKDNINRTDFTHADLLNPAAAMPPESSSESANDSFTCSEFEENPGKSHNTEIPTGRVLPQVVTVNGDNSNRNPTDDTDSNNCASSCIFSPEDGDTSKAPGHLPDDALSWDYLLNWGPNFQKLVGVFTDIAELPDVTLCNKLPLPPKMCSPRLKMQSPRPRSPAPPPGDAELRKQATSPLMHPHDRVVDVQQSNRHSTDSPQFGSRPSSRQSTQSPSRFLHTSSPTLSSTPMPCLSGDVINEHIKEEYV